MEKMLLLKKKGLPMAALSLVIGIASGLSTPALGRLSEEKGHKAQESSTGVMPYIKDFIGLFRWYDWGPNTQEAEKKLETVEMNQVMQKNALEDLKSRIAKNEMDRAAFDELFHSGVASQVSALSFIQGIDSHPLVETHFKEGGLLSSIAEKALAEEYKKMGFFEQVPSGTHDNEALQAVRKLYRLAESPFERHLKMTYGSRYFIPY